MKNFRQYDKDASISYNISITIIYDIFKSTAFQQCVSQLILNYVLKYSVTSIVLILTKASSSSQLICRKWW